MPAGGGGGEGRTEKWCREREGVSLRALGRSDVALGSRPNLMAGGGRVLWAWLRRPWFERHALSQETYFEASGPLLSRPLVDFSSMNHVRGRREPATSRHKDDLTIQECSRDPKLIPVRGTLVT